MYGYYHFWKPDRDGIVNVHTMLLVWSPVMKHETLAALNFEKSFFARMKENCLEDWQQVIDVARRKGYGPALSCLSTFLLFHSH